MNYLSYRYVLIMQSVFLILSINCATEKSYDNDYQGFPAFVYPLLLDELPERSSYCSDFLKKLTEGYFAHEDHLPNDLTTFLVAVRKYGILHDMKEESKQYSDYLEQENKFYNGTDTRWNKKRLLWGFARLSAGIAIMVYSLSSDTRPTKIDYCKAFGGLTLSLLGVLSIKDGITYGTHLPEKIKKEQEIYAQVHPLLEKYEKMILEKTIFPQQTKLPTSPKK